MKIGETIVFRARKTVAHFTLARAGTLAETSAGQKPKGRFLGLSATVMVQSGSVFVLDGLVVWDIPAGSEVGARIELRLGDDGLQGTWQLP